MIKKTFVGLIFLVSAGFLCAQEAVIRELGGTVEVKAPGEAAWSPARKGQSLTLRTMISTGFRSTALLAIGNATVTVRPLTRLSLEELERTEDGEKAGLNLRAGRVRADVKPPAGGRTEFIVKSPSATASVRGTIFEFDGIRLSVDEGRVHISGGDSTGTYVGAGHSVTTDIETGRTAAAALTAKEELAPSLPAGADSAPQAPVAAAPSRGENVEAGFDWQ
ncbi:MAG: FecR family protein [Spirochaetales bacterium]|jgi:hypothetical protein|nr:FecR family protein [Spirochaetales bacterium]